MIENYYGLNQKIIPKDAIPFNEPLLDGEMIENTKGTKIMWDKDWHGYRIFTDNPSQFLSNDDIYSQWRKEEGKIKWR